MAAQQTVEVISDEANLEGVEDAWRRLAEEAGNPFVTPEWYRAWLRHFGADASPRAVVVRNADRVRGIMPLVEEQRGGRPVIRFAGGDVGDFFHPVAPQADQPEVAACAGELLRETNAMVLDRAGPSTAWAEALAGRMPRHARVDYRQAPLPYLDLDNGGWEGYLASRSRNFRSQVGRKLRALERRHRVVFRESRGQEDLEADFAAVMRLHAQRWTPRGGSSALRGGAPEFHREFAAVAARRGWARIWFLEVDGEVAAGWYGWRIGGRYAYYLAGFSPRWADASVGFLLLARTVRAAYEEGADAYDFLLGDEAYKSRFTGDQREVRTIALGRRGPAYLQLSAEAALWRAGNHLPAGVRARAVSAYRRVSLSGRRR